MIVGIIGSGGREHSLCHSINKSPLIKKIYCFPGNAGTENIAENIKIENYNFENLKRIVKEKNIDLLIVGPEKPLVDGMVDFFEKEKIKIFGPNKICSQLEGSKIFTKKICEKYKIPTAKFGIFKDKIQSLNFLSKSNYPIVVKADGLASGKGVYICEKLKEAEVAISEIFDGKFGVAKNVLIEEFLKGEEMSYFIISDGIKFAKFQTAQDHKRVLEGDRGKNTGGMGAYSPSNILDNKLEKKILDKIIKPTLKAIKDLGTEYKGFLYAGLMIVKNEPYLIEYNVRMGDPECQTILPRLESDLLNIILDCCNKNLKPNQLKWKTKNSLCIVLCSKGYPDSFKKNVLINNLEKIKISENDRIYHAGTYLDQGKIFSNGGRVLNFVSLSESFSLSRKKVVSLINDLNWSNGNYRKDIGYKVIDK